MTFGQRTLRPLVLFLTAVVVALGSMVVTPSIASAATSGVFGTLTASAPTYTHNVVSSGYPCAAGSTATHYRVYSARIVGTAASVLTATVTPSGFRANLGSYDGSFQPGAPNVNCNGDTPGSASGSPVTSTLPTPELLPGFTERTYVFVVAGYGPSDLGSFSLSVTSTNATSVIVTDTTPTPPGDTTKPVLSGMTDLTREATTSAGADVTFAPTATDAVDGSRPVTCTPASGSTFAIGTTPVTCKASDLSDNEATGSFNVTVRDTNGPVITVPADMTVEAAMVNVGTPVTYAASAVDAVDGTRSVTCTPASGSEFPRTSTTVECQSTDTRGNSSTKEFTVLVRDTIAPTLSVSNGIRQQATSDAGAPAYFGSSTASDMGSGLNGSPSCTPASGSVFPVGITTVTCSIADLAGNIGYDLFDVTVYKGTLAVTGSVIVSGDAKVGKTLTATSTIATTPASSSTTTQWLRNGSPIASATGTTYVLTAADLGKTITYRRADALGGYEGATSTSNAVGPIAEGDIALEQPAISGTAQVGKTLTLVPGAVSPTDADRAYEWFVGSESVGTATTYVVKPADFGKIVRVEVVATKTAYAATSSTSDATDAVVAGFMDATGTVTVSGTPKVGQTLTATSTVETTPASDAPTGQWFRGNVPIADADQATYVPTNADAGSVLTYAETRTKTGYETVTTTSAPTGTVTGGVITSADPVISGSPRVDHVLTASVASVDPADATTVFTWFVGGAEASTSSTYTLKPADVGSAVKVEATTSKPYFDPVTTTSTSTSNVAQASFVDGPTAAITGVLKIGEKLTAETGTPSPVQDSFTYEWFADGTPIHGANDKTFTLTSAQKDKRISVKVTAVRAGYVDADDTSAESAAVVTNLAPGLSLTPSVTELRLGQSTTLSWTSLDAISMEASGSWSGAKAPKGSETVTPSAVGTSTYVLRATNGSGTTTAQVAVPVALPAAKLSLAAKSSVRADQRLAIKASGLAAGEKYTIRLGGKLVTTGEATSAGRVNRKVRVPSSVKAGKRVLRVTGSAADRTAARTAKVVRVEALKLVLADSKVRASDRQRVTVSRLLPGEKVTVTYQGKRVSPKSARANRKGVFTMMFDVDVTWGEKTVTATGRINKRSASRTFSVVNRCPQGGYHCR